MSFLILSNSNIVFKSIGYVNVNILSFRTFVDTN